MDRLKTTHGSTFKARSGMTLVEVMIAVVLLSIGLLSMLALQIHAMRGSQLGRHYTEAAQIARDQMEVLQNLAWTAIPPAAWSPPVAVPVAIQIDGQPDAVEQIYTRQHRVTIDPQSPANLRLIDVRVTWYEANDPTAAPPRRRYAMTSSRFNDGN